MRGVLVRDMMLDAVEKRFVVARAPHPVEHLSDYASAYIAKLSWDFAMALNLVPRFTSVHSLESKGVPEAFVKTFQRDYDRVIPLPDGATMLRQIVGWVEDLNEIHPPTALEKCSPREFIWAQAE